MSGLSHGETLAALFGHNEDCYVLHYPHWSQTALVDFPPDAELPEWTEAFFLHCVDLPHHLGLIHWDDLQVSLMTNLATKIK